jgi:hypothetical protein
MVQNPTYEQLMAENAALRNENRELRAKLGLAFSELPLKSEPTPLLNERLQPIQKNISVTQASPADEKIDLFLSLFRGRTDVYAKRWSNNKTGKNGYSPVCLNIWKSGICDKRKHKCPACPNRRFAALDKSAIYGHLSGNSPTAADVVGLYAMTEDECCYFLAIDFDEEDWRNDISVFRQSCGELGLSVAVERSRSGNGSHAWFFFDEKVSAAAARKFGSGLLTYAMNHRHEIKFKSYDRFFPSQDIMPSGGFGSLIALPLQGFRNCKNLRGDLGKRHA